MALQAREIVPKSVLTVKLDKRALLPRELLFTLGAGTAIFGKIGPDGFLGGEPITPHFDARQFVRP